MRTDDKKAIEEKIHEIPGVFKHYYFFNIQTMDSPSPGLMPEVRFKKHSGLHDADNRFVKEVIKVVTSLDGSSTMQLKIHSKFPTRFILTLMDPPVMTLDDMHQIFLMNSKIISIKIDLEHQNLKIEAFKHNETMKKKRKRVAYDEFRCTGWV
jgi:hypothetical protein